MDRASYLAEARNFEDEMTGLTVCLSLGLVQPLDVPQVHKMIDDYILKTRRFQLAAGIITK